MVADSHVPTPRGLLCNAGAGAAAGNFISFDSFCFRLRWESKLLRSVCLGVNFIILLCLFFEHNSHWFV